MLIILTDGQISDMDITKQKLVDLSELACSVIIIGVGDADFSSMKQLDGDGDFLKDDNERSCKRDIV